MKYIASIDTEPPRSADFTDPEAAVAWARGTAAGKTWVVSEFPNDGPPRTVASEIGDDVIAAREKRREQEGRQPGA